MIFKIIIKQLFSFFKKTNRKFYKVNEGFNKDEQLKYGVVGIEIKLI